MAPDGLAPATPRSAPGENRRLIVISNRVGPIETGQAASGGLAVALRNALGTRGGIWFGFSGEVHDEPSEIPKREEAGNILAATLDLSRRDFDEYYVGYANRVLWPLFHYRPSLVEFSRQQLAGYLRVNDTFARVLAPMLAPRDLIWVHDYHLIPFGAALRRHGATQPLGFFLHTSFPAAELLRLLPNHRDMMQALCAYDLVGFQTAADLHGFRDYLTRFAGAEDRGGGYLRAFGRTLRAAVFPVGIDVATVAAQGEAAEKSRHWRRLEDSIGARALMVGVDRLDYSKGLEARFEAYAHLLKHYPEGRGRIVYLQIAPPSRTAVPEFREIRRRLEAATGHINGRYAEFDWTPLRYLNKSFNHRILMGFFRASRIGLVTPYRDGMNLVAKEYLASQRQHDPGMLVLSCFAGAAQELGEAILVNPYDIEGMADAIRQGLEMPVEERRERWTAMMKTLSRNDIAAWSDGFLAALAAAEGGR
ncbi:MAG TPA: trehalose-6-phosphate synthase [Stellaceae bacterium]|jgi:trehalose 6-phosphate synthase|nr:trehalose-6-phosphate synthase [Stellaceae bacterium]